MIMLFSQMDRLAWLDVMISLMKLGQLCGHSCFSTDMRTRFSLFSSVFSAFMESSELEHWMINWTTKLRIPANRSAMPAWLGRVGSPMCRHHRDARVHHHPPWHWSRGSTFHLVRMTWSSTCSARNFVCEYVASERILSTMSHESGSSLNWFRIAWAVFCYRERASCVSARGAAV